MQIMKKTPAFLVIILAAWACAPLKKIDSYSLLNKVDFRPYSEKGFLFTPEKYNGDYESIGIIDFIKMPGAVYSNIKNMKGNTAYLPESPEYPETTSQWFFEPIDLNQVLEELYQQCQSLGADALMNFKLEANEDKYSVDISNPTTVVGYRITGFAIKRKR